MKELQPPHNLHRIRQRCCAHCAYGAWHTGSNLPAIECRRPDGPIYDLEGTGGPEWFMVCDGWKDPNGEPPSVYEEFGQ